MTTLSLRHLEPPKNYKFNQFVCFEFLLVGLEKIRSANEVSKSSGNAYVLLAGGAVGMANVAQGLELLLKAILNAKSIEEPRRNHQILDMYRLIADDEVLGANLIHLSQSLEITVTKNDLEETVNTIHSNFMPSRYLGLNPKNLEIPNADKATLLVISLIATFFGDFAHDTVVRLGFSDAIVSKIFDPHSP